MTKLRMLASPLSGIKQLAASARTNRRVDVIILHSASCLFAAPPIRHSDEDHYAPTSGNAIRQRRVSLMEARRCSRKCRGLVGAREDLLARMIATTRR